MYNLPGVTEGMPKKMGLYFEGSTSTSPHKIGERSQKRLASKNIVGDTFWPLILLLKFTGCTLLAYNEGKRPVERVVNQISVSNSDGISEAEKDEPRIERQYKVELSPSFLWSVGAAIYFTICWVSVLLDSGLNVWKLDINLIGNVWLENFRTGFAVIMRKGAVDELYGTDTKRLEKIMEMCSRVAFVLIPSGELAGLVSGWTESNSLSHFLNSWTTFEENFKNTFASSVQMTPDFILEDQRRLRRWRNILFIFCVFFPSIALLLLCVQLDKDSGQSVFVHCVLIIPFVVQAGTRVLVEDVKVILTYLTLAGAFVNIRDGIQWSLKGGQVTPEKVREWRDLVNQVRDQVAKVGSSQKWPQLWSITTSTGLVTVFIYILLNGPCTATGYRMYASVLVGYSLFLIFRLYLKVIVAEGMTLNEFLIAGELARMKIDCRDLALQAEIKFLYSMIVSQSSTIVLGNYVVLNKGLLLGVLSQIVTYLIILMQFSQ